MKYIQLHHEKRGGCINEHVAMSHWETKMKVQKIHTKISTAREKTLVVRNIGKLKIIVR